MAIDFELSSEQKQLQKMAREFSREVVQPCAVKGDAEPDPQKAFLTMKPAFEEAYKLGICTSFLPKEYGGGGVSNVDFVIAAEEICAVDPGFATIVLVNGLGLMPLTWFGTKQQQEKWIPLATQGRHDFLAGWVVSERGGTANFDHPGTAPTGIGLIAQYDKANGEYILNGEKHWPCNAGGWDLQGADVNCCIVRTDSSKGGKEGLSGVMIPRETSGISYEVIDKIGHRTCQNVTMKFEDVRVPEEDCFALGDGDFVINRTFTWSGPVAAIAAVAVARCAYEFTLNWAKTYTGGGAKPIINHQAVGNLLTEIAANIEAARYMCWKTAHYMDMHDSEGQAFGSLNKIFSAELMFQTVFQCMRVMGINSVDKRYPLEKCLREAIIFPLYDAGNLAMQRRKAWGVMADPAFDPMAFVDCAPIKYKKSMEGYGVLGENATEGGGLLLPITSNGSLPHQSKVEQQVSV